jgi:type IV secretion system protein VirB10
LIGAAPSIAAESSSSEIGAETAERVAENFITATGTIIGEYAGLPPIIAVEQAARVTIMVDRDLEFS